MDVGAFVQENRRWLLGCGIGGVAWLISGLVVGSLYRATPATAAGLGAPTKVYDASVLAAAKTEGEQLTAERQRLQQALAFVPSEKYQLAGKGAAGDYLFQVGRDLKKAIVNAGLPRDVEVAESNLMWESPMGIDEIRGTLLALEIVDEVQQRLFAAHDATRRVNENAIGLAAITSIKIDRRNQKSQMRTTRPGEVDVHDVFVQEQVSVQFQADEVTAFAFCEACRRPNRTLLLDSWQLTKPQKPGEPCIVKCTLSCIAFKGGS